MSGADDYEHALGGLRGHIVYGEQTAGDTPVAWVQVKVALPYLRDAERALVAERTRADAAEAELARLTTERDAARAEAAGLRAVVEGRPAPTDAEVAAHDAAGGLWIVGSGGELNPWVSAAGVRYHRARVERYGEPLWFLALSAERRPCPWPTVAAEAATALAGEGR